MIEFRNVCLKRLIRQWPSFHCYFDRITETESGNERVQRVIRWLKDPEMKLFCNFVVYALKPLNVSSTAFQIMSVELALYKPMHTDSYIL